MSSDPACPPHGVLNGALTVGSALAVVFLVVSAVVITRFVWIWVRVEREIRREDDPS
jgi:hypothetical protein